ncbi:DUF6801 domain-containing protein [Streptomyces iconiensis]|uniref:DUF6801 domain-containing protein n=1 Tax=Streptomyces iconiensis TaxID=1384038 RepID=A0ABT7A899_9ACTN|nr:DUF6801 domain-containing protein [Streptomyces iconiensis]MDJ1137558.1 hypothetical protein [Streptomyces iconiensis]
MNPSARTRRRTARLAAVGAVALLAGALPGTGSQAREQEAKVTAAYDCALPKGTARIEAVFTGNFPESAAPDKPLQPGELSAEVKVPRGALADVLPEGAVSVTSEAALTVRVAQGDASADADWSGLKAPSTPVPESGDLTLAHKGEVPPVTVAAEGDVTFTAGDLALELDPKAPKALPSDGPSTLPAEVAPRIVCKAAPDQDLRLAIVRVGGDAEGPGSPSPSASGEAPRPSASEGGEGQGQGKESADRREAGIDVGAEAMPPPKPCESERPTGNMDRSKFPVPPKGSTTTVSPMGGIHWCAVPVAVSNVLKLRGAMVINDPRAGAATANLAVQKEWVNGPEDSSYNQLRSLGEIDLPDSRATFLDFDFMPVTAKIEFTSSPMTIVTEQRHNDLPNYAYIYMSQTLRMHDVEVNGTALPVGPNCRTAKPISLELRGKSDEYSVFGGGTLRAKLDIPPFTGCGTGGENLNPLFTASISGSGNYLKMEQGMVCNVLPTTGKCPAPPEVPELPK